MRDMVDKELDRLLAEDIIEPVQYSDWAAPVVPVMKADKMVRLCGDYKLTVNQVANMDRYPLPRIEDLYAQLGNGTTYTKLDMRHAYEQIELHPESRNYVTIYFIFYIPIYIFLVTVSHDILAIVCLILRGVSECMYVSMCIYVYLCIYVCMYV